MIPAYQSPAVTLYQGHALEVLRDLPAESVQCVVTSPPYWGLRDYGPVSLVWEGEPGCEHEWGAAQVPATKLGLGGNTNGFYAGGVFDPGKVHATAKAPEGSAFCLRCGAWRASLGLEPTPQLYVRHLVAVMREVRRVLRSDGTCFLNLGDTRAETREWAGLPHRVLFALQDDGWRYEDEIVWAKTNPMPESQTNRTTRAHEMIFVLNKSREAYWDQEAVREPPTESTLARVSLAASRQGAKQSRRAATDQADGYKRSREARVSSDTFENPIDHLVVPPHPNGRNLRSVWSFATQPMTLEWCKGCGKVYGRAQYAYLRKGTIPRCQTVVDQEGDERCGGTAWQVTEEGLLLCLDCETPWAKEQVDGFPKAKRCNRCKGDQWGSHFATFPEELVRRCLLAGTSEWGCCPECGAPWERVIEKAVIPHDGETGTAYSVGSAANRLALVPQAARQRGNNHDNPFPQGKTAGWRPTCAHADLTPVPCVALDPFVGSGTVPLVAQKLGRRAIGIDLSGPYLELAKARLEEVALPLGGG